MSQIIWRSNHRPFLKMYQPNNRNGTKKHKNEKWQLSELLLFNFKRRMNIGVHVGVKWGDYPLVWIMYFDPPRLAILGKLILSETMSLIFSETPMFDFFRQKNCPCFIFTEIFPPNLIFSEITVLIFYDTSYRTITKVWNPINIKKILKIFS